MLKETLEMSWENIKSRKLRFALTVLGIVIGIAAVVALISLGTGFQSSLSDVLEQFGPDKIYVASAGQNGPPGTGIRGESLKDGDVKKIKKMFGVKEVVGMDVKSYIVSYGKESRYLTVWGLPAEDTEKFFRDIQAFELSQGRFIRSSETGSVILGSTAADGIFSNEIAVRDTVAVRGKKFKVVGILKSIGNPQDDNTIMMSLDDLRELSGDGKGITMIMVKVSDPLVAERVSKDIEDYLDGEYGEGSFMAMTTEQVMERVGAIFSLLSLVLAGIASISLVVAGVGIMNTMFTSVTERTREIGVMKAIGATNTDILKMFIIESASIGFIGGLIGVGTGMGISYGMSIIAERAMGLTLKIVPSPQIVLAGLGFAVLVGVISGVWPAYQAAKMQPSEALRYE